MYAFMTEEPPDTPFWRKIRARAKHYGVDRLSDKLLIKIARVSVPNLRPDRRAAIAIIIARKLPFPVPLRTMSQREREKAKGAG